MNENGRKRVLIITPSFGGGGAERVGVTLINSFDESKYDLFVITFGERNDYFADIKRKVGHVCLQKKRPLDFFKLVFEIRKTMLDFKPEVIISILHYYNLICGCASLLVNKKFTLVLCEHSFHRSFLIHSRWAVVKKMMMKFLYQRADQLVAISNRMREAMIEDFGLDPDKVVVIHNPLPLEDIKIKSHEKVIHPFFENGKNIVIISVGRLESPKRFDILLEAFAVVRQQRAEVRLIILGKGSQLEKLQKLATELNVSGVIDFVGFKDNPYAWMKRANVFVLSSDYEGFPMVLIEAMACGIPVIASNCPSGPDEIIEQDINGILVPPGDKKTLAENLLSLLTSPQLRLSLAQAAEKRITDYAVERILAQYESLWNTNRPSVGIQIHEK